MTPLFPLSSTAFQLGGEKEQQQKQIQGFFPFDKLRVRMTDV
jgi:hypothetical protein